MCLPSCWALVSSSLLRSCWPGCVNCASNSSSWTRAHSTRSALHHTPIHTLCARAKWVQNHWQAVMSLLCVLHVSSCCQHYDSVFFYRWSPKCTSHCACLNLSTLGKSAQVWSQNPAAADGVDGNVSHRLQGGEDGRTPERHHPQDSSMWRGKQRTGRY